MAKHRTVKWKTGVAPRSPKDEHLHHTAWGADTPRARATWNSPARRALAGWAAARRHDEFVVAVANVGLAPLSFVDLPGDPWKEELELLQDLKDHVDKTVKARPDWDDAPPQPDAQTVLELNAVRDDVASFGSPGKHGVKAIGTVVTKLWQLLCPSPAKLRAAAHRLTYLPAIGAILHIPASELGRIDLVGKRLSDIGTVCDRWGSLITGPCDPALGRFATTADLEAIYGQPPLQNVGNRLLEPNVGGVRPYHDDALFAAMRVVGPNPIALRRVSNAADLPPELAAVVPPNHPALDVAAGALYMVDFRDQGGMVGTSFQGGPPKYLQATVGLFRVDAGHLAPVAIWLAKPVPRAVRPGDADWWVARQWLQVSDLLHHEMYTHLGRSHYVMLALTRSIYAYTSNHGALRKFLEPSLSGVVANMEVGARTLTPPDGMVDELLPPGIDACIEYAKQGERDFHFGLFDPSVETASRGCGDPALLPFYPYRDDAKAIWDAMYEYASAVLTNLNYQADLKHDWESLFLKLVEDWKAPRVSPITPDLAGLIHFVTGIMFHSGPFHAAVNYPQDSFNVVVPAWPGSSFAAPGQEGPGGVNMLPPREAVARQIEVMTLLSMSRFERINQVPILQGFAAEHAAYMNRLDAIEQRIQGAGRRFAYDYLRPSMVPCAANV